MKKLILVMRYSAHNYQGSILGIASDKLIAEEMEKDDFSDYIRLGCISPEYEPRYERIELPEVDKRIHMF